MAYRKTRSREPITQARLRELVTYDRDTGLFVSIKKRPGGAAVGSVLGTPIGAARYMVAAFDYQLYYLHRLAWFYETGEWPTETIDHKDGDRQNNRFINLRLATMSEQLQNKVMPMGCHLDNRTGRWAAQIRFYGKRRRLGSFPTSAEAHAAYLAAKARLHTFQPVPRDAGGLGGTPPE